MLALAVVGLGLGACLPAEGWRRTDRRACAPQSPAIVCLGDEEGPFELRVGPSSVLPGECIVAPRERGGRVEVELFVSGRSLDRRSVMARGGARTELWVDDDRVRVSSRDRCDLRVDEP